MTDDKLGRFVCGGSVTDVIIAGFKRAVVGEDAH
jgi:hypothetical protein